MTSLNQFNYLDLNVLVSEVIGSWILATLLLMAVVSIVGYKKNIPLQGIVLLDVLCVFAVAGFYLSKGWLAIIAVIIGFVVYALYSSIFK